MTGQRVLDGLARLDAIAAERGVRLEHDVPLGPLTTLRVGGAADRMVTPSTTAELVDALDLARDAGVPVGILGKGSDIVVADRGVRGLVIRNRADSVDVAGTAVRADSGAAMAAVVKRCTAAALGGLEFGISIPGTIGGAVWANAGAHGREMRDVTRRARVWRPSGVEELAGEECEFQYRSSTFKTRGGIVLDAELELTADDPTAVAERVSSHQAQRKATQPLADQNAGSVFRNPPGDFAGRLAEASGLKGVRIGSARVSELHANFIVVDRGGSASDVRAVGELVRRSVRERFGVELVYEIEFVGDWRRDEHPEPAWSRPLA